MGSAFHFELVSSPGICETVYSDSATEGSIAPSLGEQDRSWSANAMRQEGVFQASSRPPAPGTDLTGCRGAGLAPVRPQT